MTSTDTSRMMEENKLIQLTSLLNHVQLTMAADVATDFHLYL